MTTPERKYVDDVPEGIEARLRTICLALPDAYEQQAWVGVRWMVRNKTFAHVLGIEFDGKVARVSPTVDPSTRSVTVYVQIPNADGSMKGGTFASGRVVSRTVPDALVVPAAAVRQRVDDGATFVYRVAGNTLDIAPVTLGIVDQRMGIAEIVRGLDEGDRVVVGNVGTLGRGMQVIIAGEERPAAGRP